VVKITQSSAIENIAENLKDIPFPIQVKGIATHRSPDLDAFVAICIGALFGDPESEFHTSNQFPGWFETIRNIHKGTKTKRIHFWPQGPPPDGRSAKQWLIEDGIVTVDTGELFNHHPHQNYPGLCSADIVAAVCEARKQPELQEVLDYTRSIDLDGVPPETQREPPFGGRKALICLQNRHSDPKVALHRFFSDLFVPEIKIQHHFFKVALPELKKGEVWYLTWQGREIKVLTIETNIDRVAAAARSSHGGNFGIIIQRNRHGTQVLKNYWHKNLDFTEVAKVIRVLELIAQGYDLSKLNLRRLADNLVEEECDICPWWYLPINRQGLAWAIMNGSAKAEVPRTKLALPQINQAVRFALDDNYWASCCPHWKGKNHCLGEKCPAYIFQLEKCQKTPKAKTHVA